MANLGSTHYFVLVSFVGLLGIPIFGIDFDLIVLSLIGDFVVTYKILRDCLVMIGYREITVDLMLLDFQDLKWFWG